jgi:excisionase family DNA binding protein
MTNDSIMTTRELAKYIKLNEKTLIKLAQNGQIPGVKIGNQWRFHSAAIDSYLQGNITHTPNRASEMFVDSVTPHIALSRLTNSELIELDYDKKDAESVLSKLAMIAYTNRITSSQEDLVEQLHSREKMLSTAIGKGVAIPHARHPSPSLFKEPKIIILRTKNGIAYGAPDERLVQLFFMICAPSELIHLRLLARISRKRYFRFYWNLIVTFCLI